MASTGGSSEDPPPLTTRAFLSKKRCGSLERRNQRVVGGLHTVCMSLDERSPARELRIHSQRPAKDLKSWILLTKPKAHRNEDEYIWSQFRFRDLPRHLVGDR